MLVMVEREMKEFIRKIKLIRRVWRALHDPSDVGIMFEQDIVNALEIFRHPWKKPPK